MFQTLINIFKVPELRNKILFTLLMLAIYRVGYWIPIPGVDQQHFEEMSSKNNEENSAAGRLANFVSLFSGGSLQQSTIFGLGVMPYISASIIFQLLTTVIPTLEKMNKEGESGRKRIQEWTRYSTVALCFFQAIFWIEYMRKSGLVQYEFNTTHVVAFYIMAVSCMTAGSVFLMWLGEQIDEYGLGNGISLIILAGIVARMPFAIGHLITMTSFSAEREADKPLGLGHIIFLVASFLFVVAGAILITQAQRRIPVQQAKHTRGRRVYGGSKQYLPLRVNHGGVMPIIFAQSLMLFPGVFFGWLSTYMSQATAGDANPTHGIFYKTIQFLNNQFNSGAILYIMLELIMIYFFAYFWTTVQFQPKEMASQLRDYGSFVPGLRPGKRTADYLERVMMRITYVGAAFLCIIAIIPTAVSTWMKIPYDISSFLGGTGLLIVVSVALDMVQRIEANLLMRNYGGFLGESGKRIKGRQY
jgi:preprotein translocase subunit SecY